MQHGNEYEIVDEIAHCADLRHESLLYMSVCMEEMYELRMSMMPRHV